MATSALEGGPSGYDGTLVQVKGNASGAWMPAANRELLSVVDRAGLPEPTPVEIMVDGEHMKVFVAGVRVANVPNAQVVRSDRLHFEDTYFSTPENPIFIGAIHVDAGGRDLYGALERDGRVALEGIYFDTGSDRLRTESFATLAEVGEMLEQHPDQLSFIPFVSREQTDFALTGRVPGAIEDGSLEARAGLALDVADSQVMICGNPEMVSDTQTVLKARGMKKNRRREPGQITTEQYWKT